MAIITISRSFCSKGSIVAEKVAEALGYECISREILLEASEQFNTPQVKLAKAIHDGPSVFERVTHGKERYIAFIRAALFNHLKNDNCVYHGLAGHFLVQEIPNVLKIRLLSDMESRVEEEMHRENVSAVVARKRLLQDDKDRLSWSNYLYKMDPSDPELYDMIINLRNISINDCVDIICKTANLEFYKSSDSARTQLEDAAMKATVKAAIVEKYYNASVSSVSGKVAINIETPVTNTENAKSEIHELLKNIPDISSLQIDLKSSDLPRTVMHK